MKKETIDLENFKKGIKGKNFAELIKHHLKKQSQEQLSVGVLGTVQMLEEKVQPSIMEFIDHWNTKAYDEKFWQEDCAKVFEDVTDDARGLLKKLDCKADDESLFNMFQIIVLNYAYSACDQPKMREFMGIDNKSEDKISQLKKNDSAKYGWTAILLFVLGLIFSNTQSNFLMGLGYILGNISYILGIIWLFKIIRYLSSKQK